MNVRPGADYLLKVTNESGTAVFCRLSCQSRQRLHEGRLFFCIIKEEKDMYLYNSATHKKEEFIPIDPNLV